MNSVKSNAKNFRIPVSIKYFLIAMPFVIFTFMFSYVPLFGWIISFSNYKTGMTLSSIRLTGFGAFVSIWNQRADILRVVTNSLAISGLGLLTSPLSIVFAILLNELRLKKFKRIVQTVTIFPNFISWIVVFGFAYTIFSSNGMMNNLLSQLGFHTNPTGLIGDKNRVWLFQVGLQVWKGLGWGAIIYLATIAGIDTELYEAAKADGAGRFRCIWHITLPGIIPTFFVLLVLGISNILNNGFDQYFVFNNPLVANKIEVLDLYTYKVGIQLNKMPFSVAIGMLKSFISIALLFIANLGSKKVRGVSIY